MTVTEATRPAPLPVREGSARREPGGLSPTLTRLAAERATGTLEREHGTLYLADGQVVHAESPHAPGLGVLLASHGILTAEAWREAVRRAGGPYGALHVLLRAGEGRGPLEVCHTGALFDAGYFALAPSRSPGHFRHGGGRQPAPARAVSVAALERETLRRRTLLEHLWPDPRADSAPLLRTHTPATASSPRQRALLTCVDGTRTAPEIAHALGRHTFHTLVDVRRLTAAGLIVAGVPPPPAPDPAQGLALPRTDDPDITLLKRLRDALEAL